MTLSRDVTPSRSPFILRHADRPAGLAGSTVDKLMLGGLIEETISSAGGTRITRGRAGSASAANYVKVVELLFQRMHFLSLVVLLQVDKSLADRL